MNCTRCKLELIGGNNISKDWHLPICKNCRKKMIENKEWGDNSKLTKEEIDIMYKKIEEDIGR